MKRILYILQEPLQADEAVFSGNDVRIRQLQQALQQAGHQVSFACLQSPGVPPASPKTAAAFKNRDELQGLILRVSPDVILVSYWELLSLLPFNLGLLVVLDFVAPRPLEDLFENPQGVQDNMRRLRDAMGRCDLVLTGNELQSHLLISSLLESGHDLREGLPVLTVPLGASPATPPASKPGAEGATLVMGGVVWPWRREQTWLDAIEQAALAAPAPVHVMRFEGNYRLHGKEEGRGDDSADRGVIQVSPLLPYPEYSQYLSEQAHVGVELADWNVERAFSQSFRSLDFLRHGLPLICNRYLPLARLLEQYDAGWLVDEPQDLQNIVHSITTNPQEWQQKSNAALKLANEALSLQTTTEPLLRWLEDPVKSPKLPGAQGKHAAPPILGIPPLRQRLRRQWGLVRQVATARLLGQKKAVQAYCW